MFKVFLLRSDLNYTSVIYLVAYLPTKGLNYYINIPQSGHGAVENYGRLTDSRRVLNKIIIVTYVQMNCSLSQRQKPAQKRRGKLGAPQ